MKYGLDTSTKFKIEKNYLSLSVTRPKKKFRPGKISYIRDHRRYNFLLTDRVFYSYMVSVRVCAEFFVAFFFRKF